MSKAALRKLSEHLAASTKDKTYRDRSINPYVHAIDLADGSISAEIKAEVISVDPELNSYLTDVDYKKASSIVRAHILGKVNDPKSTFRVSSDSPNKVIANNFSAFSSALKEASDKVMAYFTTVLNQKGANHVPLAGGGTRGKLLNLDHTRTVGETKIGRDLYKVSGIDPVRLVSELQRKSYLTKTKRQEVFENVLEVISYYSGNQKVFEIAGSVSPDDANPITGRLASSYVNQQEGATIIKGRVATFREAVEAAIKDTRWDDQAASDSYRDYVFKTLNNSVVKAGGVGKPQQLNTQSNSAKNSTKNTVVSEAQTKTYKMALGIRKPQSSAKSKLSLQSINDYINARLPEKVRGNMGPGSLVNRTGRFATSARVTNTTTTSQGYPSIGYTYMRSPYDVFDRTIGRAPWNTPNRDPRAIVEKSIREIAKEIMTDRFYLRRA